MYAASSRRVSVLRRVTPTFGCRAHDLRHQPTRHALLRAARSGGPMECSVDLACPLTRVVDQV